jgi:hypothetical protein
VKVITAKIPVNRMAGCPVIRNYAGRGNVATSERDEGG